MGSSIDEILLNKSCFESAGVKIKGVILNKIIPEKYDEIMTITTKGLKRHGLKVLGALPYEPVLSKPTIAEIKEKIDCKVLAGEDKLNRHINKIVVGAMLPHDAIDHFEKNMLLIVPANREGIIMTALFANKVKSQNNDLNISGIIFTGNIEPHKKILDLIKTADLPLLLAKEDSFSISAKINKLLVKIREHEVEKIQMAQKLIIDNIDLSEIIN